LVIRRIVSAGLVALSLIYYSPGVDAAQQSGLLQARAGVSALLRGKYEDAILSYTRALEDKSLSDPRRANIYNDRGVAKWRLKRTTDAIEDFNRAIELFPDFSVVYNNRGNALIDLGRPDEAIADFDRAIALAPGYGVAYNNRGNAYHAMQDFAAASRDYRKASELMPTNAVPFNGRGKTESALGHPFAAVRHFNRAIALNAKYYSAHENRGEALEKLNKLNDAVSDYTQVIALRPDTPSLYLARGRIFAKGKQYNSAFRDFDKAIKLAPDLAEAYIARADVHAKLRRYESARADLSRVLEVDASLVEAYVKRAETYLRMGVPEEGLADANQAIQLKSDDVAALNMRARMFEALESPEEAIADYNAVLDLEPANATARAALQQLGQEIPPIEKPQPLAEPVKNWFVTRESDGKYVATNPRYPKVRVPLEMYGEGVPEIIDWNLLKYELKGVGLLEYFAGTIPDSGGQRLEYVAIVDLWKARTLAIEPDTWGSSKATWDWKLASVIVTDPEGNANEIKLRKAPEDPYGDSREGFSGRSRDCWTGCSATRFPVH
jgi:tetratricopeptide (TPR) repeat protein